MRRLLLMLALGALCPGAVLADKPVAPESIPGAQRVTAEQVIELITANASLVIIDARRAEEHAKGHIEGSISLLDTDMTPQLLARYLATPDTPVLFYCNGERCKRSGHAANKAVAWGYRRVYWFRGGWREWTAKELPVAR